MSDTSYPVFQHYGTAAQRAAFTPTPGSGQPIYLWRETDTGNTYLYDTTWHVLVSSGVGDVSGPASAVASQLVLFDGTSGKLIKAATTSGVVIAASGVYGVTALPSDANKFLDGTGAFTTPGASAGAVVLITETVTTGTAANVSFTSIPSTYRDLLVRVIGRGTTAATFIEIDIRMNGDTGANYNWDYEKAVGAAFSAQEGIGATAALFGLITAASGPSNYAGIINGRIGNYKGTTFYKPMTSTVAFAIGTGASSQSSGTSFGLWRNTAAITQLDIFPTAGAFVDGTVVSLYGAY